MPAPPDAKLSMLKRAMQELRPMLGALDGLPRAFCPIAVGLKDGRRNVFVWQFAGASSQPDKIPGWRCFHLDGLEQLECLDAPWQGGDPIKGRPQSCLDTIEAHVAAAHTTADLSLLAGSGAKRSRRRVRGRSR